MCTRAIATACALVVAALLGCGGDPIFPNPHTVGVEARVTGGLAGIDYTVGIDGQTGNVIGVSCVAHCSFEDGQVLLRLSDEHLTRVLETVFATGIRSGGRDYGDGGCCDQIGSSLTWTEPGISNTITGSTTTLPDEVGRAVDAVVGFASGHHPVTVDFSTTPNEWPLDALDLREHVIEGNLLHAVLEHDGGCETHAYGLVAWNGWLESNPVRVGATLIHQDFNDPCDAVVAVEATFDLTPLKVAYQRVYGFDPDTLLVALTEPDQDAGDAVVLRYVF